MMSDQLVETNILGFEVARRMVLTEGREHVMAAAPAMGAGHAMAAGHGADGMAADSTAMPGVDLGAMDMGAMDMAAPGICKPTWVVLSPDDTKIYVPCNGRGDVLEIDAASMEVLRRFPTGAGPYNADVTPDGSKLVVTLKGEQAVTIIDLVSGKETRVRTTQPVTHGVAITPDGRFAFVSNEAVGATRGTVDVIDLTGGRIVASTALHYQPGGLGFWKMEPATR
jgi:hypothetical protein